MKLMNSLTTRRQSSLSLSGGGIVSDNLSIPSYSPNAVSTIPQPFPWDETVDDINTPDIDPSFFDNGPLFSKKFNTQNSLQLDITPTEELFFQTTDQTFQTTDEMSKNQSIHPSLEENYDFSSLINQNIEENTLQNTSFDSQSLEAMNQFIPTTTTTTTAPVLHYLEPRTVDSIPSTVNIEFITTPDIIDSLNSQSIESFTTQFMSPSHSQQSYSPSLSSVTQPYVSPTPSPALSHTSTTSCPSTLIFDSFTSDTNTTIDSTFEVKPEPEFLQPTVINDHLYTLPSKSGSGRKRKLSGDKTKNNMASKKSRVTKRDKQKQMDEQIQHYITDNAKCKREIERMEKEIAWCKNYLFAKVTSAANK